MKRHSLSVNIWKRRKVMKQIIIFYLDHPELNPDDDPLNAMTWTQLETITKMERNELNFITTYLAINGYISTYYPTDCFEGNVTQTYIKLLSKGYIFFTLSNDRIRNTFFTISISGLVSLLVSYFVKVA